MNLGCVAEPLTNNDSIQQDRNLHFELSSIADTMYVFMIVYVDALYLFTSHLETLNVSYM